MMAQSLYQTSPGQLQSQDYGNQSYSSGPNNQQAQQKGDQMSSGGSNDDIVSTLTNLFFLPPINS